MAEIVTTRGEAIKQPNRDKLTIYDEQGRAHVCAPVDAHEIVAGGNYFWEPPAVQIEGGDDAKQHVVSTDAPDEDAESAEAQAVAQDAIDAGLTATKRRKRNA